MTMCMSSNTTSVQPSCDSLGKITWVRYGFLSQDNISDILIRCARKHQVPYHPHCINFVDPSYIYLAHTTKMDKREGVILKDNCNLMSLGIQWNAKKISMNLMSPYMVRNRNDVLHHGEQESFDGTKLNINNRVHTGKFM